MRELLKGKRKWIAAAVIAAMLVVFETVQYIRIERAISYAQSCLDLKYKLGEAGPDRYDCSGLVKMSYAACGKSMPHSAEKIGNNGWWLKITSAGALRRGDIVCFDTEDDDDLSDHVGIYLGDGTFIHASSGKGKVVISELKDYYAEHFSWARRPILHI